MDHLKDGLAGISAHAMLMHLRLYERYQQRLAQDEKDDEAKNAVEFHSLFFSNLIRGGVDPSPRMIETHFKHLEAFVELELAMKEALASVNGWVILGRAPERALSPRVVGPRPLRVVTVQGHTIGWDPEVFPVLVLDGWEHAYFLDFGIAKEAYVEALWKNIDWSKVEERLEVRQ